MNRLQTPLPKLGIRPVIDGRYGGVRESLENQVMAMAKATARMVSKEARHASGEMVECVIADTCIGGLAESAQCDAKFAREGVGLTLTVTPCWCYGSETMDTHQTRPKAVWGFNGTERPGAVYLAAVLAGHAQKGLPAFGIYGRDVQDAGDKTIPEDVQEKILRFVRAGVAAATMKGTTYAAMGGTSMGIAGSIVDTRFFEQYLGMKVMHIDMSEFSGRIAHDVYDPKEFKKAMRWVKANCKEGKDWNDPAKQRTRVQKDQDWETSVKMTLIARDLMVGNPNLAELGYQEQARGHNALMGGFQGQRQWTDHYPNGDFMEAVLTSSFDWNGKRQPFAFATENDCLNATSMLFGHLLTGTAQLFSDVRTYWSLDAIKRVTGVRPSIPSPLGQGGGKPDGVLHLINSGPSALDWTGASTPSPWAEGRGGKGVGVLVGNASVPSPLGEGQGGGVIKHWRDLTKSDVEACLKATRWCPSMTEYFPGGGWSTDYTTRGGMPCTMCRVNLVAGLGPVLQIAEGWTVELPEKVHKVLDERTNPTWPTTWFVPRLTGKGVFTSVYDVMNAWGANHGAICYGHIGADLVSLASILRIPVDMHNVETLFRPSAWNRFGTADLESADYRACATYGPLYG
ncbi:MAG TPA: L-fucose isomerase [Fimbriimonadaceae bacterium]|nr:L-fucose isomerase [Fimbriimonadaceae bacterium]